MQPSNNKQTPVSSALAEAQAIVDAAEEKAKKIIDDAILSSEEIKETGYREGLRVGKDLATKNSIKIIREHQTLRENIELEAARLTYKILEHIFLLNNEEIISPIKELAKKLLVSVPIGRSIDLVFHPTHVDTLSSIKEELQNISKYTELRFVQSEDCDPTSLIIKTDFGEIKVGLKDFLSEIAKQMKLPCDK